jgi:hypothetical protein
VKITAFCDVAPHSVLYGGICCLHLQRFHKIAIIFNHYQILLSDKIEESEFDEIFGIHDKD